MDGPGKDRAGGEKAQDVPNHDPQEHQGLVPSDKGRLLSYVLEQEQLQEQQGTHGRKGDPSQAAPLLFRRRRFFGEHAVCEKRVGAHQEGRQEEGCRPGLPRHVQRRERALDGRIRRDAQEKAHGEGLTSGRSAAAKPGGIEGNEPQERQDAGGRQAEIDRRPRRYLLGQPGYAGPGGRDRQGAPYSQEPGQEQGQKRSEKQDEGVGAGDEGAGPQGLSDVEDQAGEQDSE